MSHPIARLLGIDAPTSGLRYLSVCSGIEAATTAWHGLGWTPAAFSEIEAFPSAVLTHHWPHVPNLGDMTKWHDWDDDLLASCDLVVGGTPCQAFSVAGLRNSLDDDRGNLTLIYVQLIDHIDRLRAERGLPPVIVVWENVPGVLSTKDNAFGCFLGSLAGDDQSVEPGPRPEHGKTSLHWGWQKDAGLHRPKWSNAGHVAGPKRSAAWRTLDAQYFGVAQRRRRVFLVASARNGFCPGEVLFESEGVRRDSPPSREAGQDTTGSTGDGVARCITTGEANRQDWETCNMIAATCRGHGDFVDSETSGALRATGADLGAGCEVLTAYQAQDYKNGTYSEVTEAGPLTTSADRSRSAPVVAFKPKYSTGVTGKMEGAPDSGGVNPPLTTAAGDTAPCVAYSLGSHAGAAEAVVSNQNHATGGPSGMGIQEEVSHSLRAGRTQAVAFSCKDHGADAGEVSPTPRSMNHDGSHANGGGQVAVVAFEPRCARNGRGMPSEVVPPLKAQSGETGKGDAAPCVAFAQNTRDEVREMAVVGALAAEPGMKQTSYIRQHTAVRRLTPVECARLQGFPDHHARTPWRGKPAEDCPDGPQYKAYGNSMAVPCMAWIGRRIQRHLSE